LVGGLASRVSQADDVESGAGELSIGSRRELFVDHFLIDHMSGARLKLHPPQPQEVVLRFDQPWEGLYCGYETVIQDGDTIRMYYRGLPEARHSLDTETTCVAESEDGVHFTKPKLGLFDVQGTSENNCVLARHRGCHNLAPFIDANPDASADHRYKALGGTGAPGLIAFTSPDGIHWNELQSEPVITEGAFDSQNNAFWSEVEQQYVCFFRVFREGTRWIARTTSEDFIHWSPPIDLEVGDQPREHLYTNQMEPYSRAPHICIGLPTRFMAGRRGVNATEAAEIGTPSQYLDDCTDILLTSSRGGNDFERTFMEAFIRPGLDLRNWTSRANYAARGIVQTSETELSLYIKHNSGYPTNHMQRYTLRPDGFVSVNAPYAGGELITKPFTFEGSRLYLNYATSAAGGLQVELQGRGGEPIEGFRFDDCPEFFGDRIEHAVTWQGGSDLSSLAGQPVRLRVVMRDTDLFAIRFQ
jgi:hypothetical protein